MDGREPARAEIDRALGGVLLMLLSCVCNRKRWASQVPAVLPLLLIATAARGGFSDNQFVAAPHMLSQLIRTAEQYGDPFKPAIRDDGGRAYAYYLKEARYVGQCQAPFGTVHVATFVFIRSGWKDGGQVPPAHGQAFVAFFDGSLRLRRFWRVDLPIEGFWGMRFDGSVLLMDERRVFDFAQVDGPHEAIFDGQLQPRPTW